MRFTVVFDGNEDACLSYGLDFQPSPIWKKNEQLFINLHSEVPGYQTGDFRKLLDKERVRWKINEGSNRVLIVVHSMNDGTREDLEALKREVEQEGFTVDVWHFSETG